MPIRIKPVYNFEPCVLTLDSIRAIIKLITENFPDYFFSASDDIWEIYDEESETFFIESISKRDILDTFQIVANSDPTKFAGDLAAWQKSRANPPAPIGVQIELTFNEASAKLSCTAIPDNHRWLEHFVSDIKHHLHPPSFSQLVVNRFGRGGELNLSLQLVYIPITTSFTTPYSRIVIRKRPPDPFIENIKANLVSNIIWVVLVFVLGFITSLIMQQ
jgi:hypothetical protein